MIGIAQVPNKVIPDSPKTYVFDEPSLMSVAKRVELARRLSDENKKTGNQLVIAIFSSLDGENMADFSNRVFRAWKIGSKNKNNGVLLTVFSKEKISRIEVGYGFEPVLTDAKTNQILSQHFTPAFQSGAYDLGIIRTADSILETIRQDPALSALNQTPAQKKWYEIFIEELFSFKVLFMIGFGLVVAAIMNWGLRGKGARPGEDWGTDFNSSRSRDTVGDFSGSSSSSSSSSDGGSDSGGGDFSGGGGDSGGGGSDSN